MVAAAVMLEETGMPEPLDILLATLLSLPDERRAAVERLLVPLARSAALGELAADIAHDVANPLFGAIGLVDLLLEDAAPASEDAVRLQMLRETALEMKGTLQVLLDFTRLAGEGTGHASLDEAVRSALRLLRHGAGRSVVVEQRYPAEPVIVPCPAGPLVQAVLQLLLAARGMPGLAVEVSGASLRISPAPAESVGTLVAERIVTDHGGRFERDADVLTLRWPGD
jgi:signal transduction histidine kinase